MPRVALIAAVVLTLVSAAARAQSHPGTPDLEAARRHYMAGTEAFQREAFGRAAREFEAAHRVSKDPLLLYNAAESHERAGALAAAVAAYRGYLAGVPQAADRADVERTIRKLQADLAARARADARASSAPPAATTPGAEPGSEGAPRLRVAAWVTAASAVALAAAGGVMTMQAKSRESDLNRRLRVVDPQTGQALPYGPVAGEYRDLVESGRRYETLSVVFYAAAAGAAVAAGTLFYLDHRRKGAERMARVRVVPQLGPKSAGLVAGVEF
ncbi:MAG TPA: hypothetical protein VGQ83_15835 [Polyangia bacterium]|jgi:hypothetical protein